MRGGVEQDDAGRAGRREVRHPARVGGLGVRTADDHPWPIDEQAPVRGRVARGLEPGHRMPADEPQAGGIGPAEDRALGAGDIGHDGGRWQRLAPRTRQRVDELQAAGRRRGQDHEVDFSINDKIVVYDRVRENLTRFKKMPLAELIDLSINETLTRTIGTSLALFLAIAPLALFGGPALREFAVVLLFGLVLATSSSIFIAAPSCSTWARSD